MTKYQRYRFEMLARVRDFGTANVGALPESSAGGKMFAIVTDAVAAVEDHLKRRDLARAEARRLKTSTRKAVTDYMTALAATARRITLGEPGPNPFRRAGSRSAEALLANARLFIDEAKAREPKFVEFGMPAGFVAEFTTLVDALAAAVTTQNNGRAWRQRAQTGIESALESGTDAVRNLDVVVTNTFRLDPVRLGHWRGARRLAGVSSPKSALTAAPAPTATDVPKTTMEKAS